VTSTDVAPAPPSKTLTAMAGMSAMNGEEDGRPAARLVAGVASSCPDLVPEPLARTTAGRAHTDDAQRHQHRAERCRVDGEGPRVGAQRDHDAGQGGADDAAQVELGGAQAHGAEQVVGVHEVGQHRLVAGEPERGHAAPAEDAPVHREGGGVAPGVEQGQQGGEERLPDRGEDQQPAAVHLVGQRTTDR
jgi:hypothetical protein